MRFAYIIRDTGCFYEQVGTVSRADYGVQEQWSEYKSLVQGKRHLSRPVTSDWSPAASSSLGAKASPEV